MKKTPSLIAAAALLAVTAGAALAQANATAAAPPPPERTPLDANKDGVIDRSEAAAHPRLAASFDSLDANKDGKLQREELPRHKGRRGPDGEAGHRQHFASLDKDGDRRISKAEAAAEPKFAGRFERMDANRDGFVDRADHEVAAKQRKDEWFKAADSNNDGNLSKAEFDAAHARRGDKAGRHGFTPAS